MGLQNKGIGGMEVTLQILMPITSVGDYSVSFCWQKRLGETPSLSTTPSTRPTIPAPASNNRTLWSTGGITTGCRKPVKILP
jgi:hypothetical protein